MEFTQKEVNIRTHTHESPAQAEGRLIWWASFYDELVNIVTLGHVGMPRSLTVDHALPKPGEKVLDVGCGTGGVTTPAKKRIGKDGMAAGIDPAPELIAVARKKAVRARLEIHSRIGVIESLADEDATFDVVTSSLMMHHLPEYLWGKGPVTVKGVLRPGELLLIADMTHSSSSMHERIFASLTTHRGHGAQFGIKDLPNC